ncbi:helix-turn-helix transcriptional regulator [Pseudomonas syringae]|nr:helix-turn-helix transcriptional regulator [Pseudomonas syringae]MBD8789101.1 helix-turn-helix transcriptional regulator [Pseudomonas syringae]MBD8800455.1 helix-turn-helix transcriptional regulator [Pseudomonas syringae]MBD8812373.1 helix-turn-helix transcriptional regulator [Pseudomonas syringae]
MNGQDITFAESALPEAVLLFGPYAFHVRQRQVLRHGQPVPMGGRALDILQVLVERAGTVVTKALIIEQVWPDSVVEAINLRVHIAALRRALRDGQDGERYIATVTHRGYSFTAPVVQVPGESTARGALAGVRHNLPACVTPLIGRDEAVSGLVRQFATRRFVTLTGPAGVGKTRLASRVAEALLPAYRDGVWQIDCSSGDPAQVLQALLTLLGLQACGQPPFGVVRQALAERQCLLVIDSAECLPQTCRQWIEQLLSGAPQLAVLVTSRQPLYAWGEWLQRVPGLALQGRDCAAVQLWVSRAQACQPGYGLREQDLPAVIDICRQLDGLPLAIELLAAQLGVFAVAGLQRQLVNSQWLLSLTRRTAVARHQSLAAALDWRHVQLSKQECELLQHLAIFDAPFSLAAAARVVCDRGYDLDRLRSDLQRLEDRSLLVTVLDEGQARYRLYNTVRLHAQTQLRASGEYPAVLARYERYSDYRHDVMQVS